jgi:RHS repeat-associated protein
MQFTGEYNNPATGLYDLRAREYDPNDGRFTSEDPVAQTLTDPYSSDYLYVNDQPTLFVDPSGNIKCKSLGFASGMCTTVVGTAKQIPDTLAMYRLALSDPSYYKYFADHTLGFSHRCMRQTGCLLQAELGLLPLPAARGPKLLKILWRFRSAEEGLGDAAATAARIHGNSASSPATSYLYRLEDAATGDYLKTGISKNPLSRYSQTFMRGKRMRIVQKGSRREMLNLERFIVERDPGPLNRERWAGQYANDIRGGR